MGSASRSEDYDNIIQLLHSENHCLCSVLSITILGINKDRDHHFMSQKRNCFDNQVLAIVVMPFSLQEREPSSNVETIALMEGQNDAQKQDRELSFNQLLLQCGAYLKSEEMIAVKHNLRREQWGFFLALSMRLTETIGTHRTPL